MPDVLHDFPIFASPDAVFDAVSTPAGLDLWWPRSSTGGPTLGGLITLDFGPDYQWVARVSESRRGAAFEMTMEVAMPDWIGTRVRFDLSPRPGGGTDVRFAHIGWAEHDDHFRISAFCWAMYLRLLKRWLEHGEVVAWEKRLDA